MKNNQKKKSKKKLIIISLAVLVLAIIVLANIFKSDEIVRQVTSGKVKKGKITSIVTASGKVKARTEINISANISANIVDLPVKEGQEVTKGQLLVQLDPDRHQAATDQAYAYLASQKAQLELSRAQNAEARLAFERAEKLHNNNLISDEVFDAARTRYDVARAQFNAAQHGVDRAEALLREAQNQFDYTIITSPIKGTITALNAEEGEMVIIGTMNNPGTVIMTVSDLSQIEVEVEVDETDIANVAIGQQAEVELDALPDTTFRGVVTEVGNSARVSGYGSQDEVTNFMVTVLMEETVSAIRPGMSATCDITTAERRGIIKVPIGAVVLRDEKDIREKLAGEEESEGGAVAQELDSAMVVGEEERDSGTVAQEQDSTMVADEEEAEDEDESETKKELEGVFVIRDGRAHFVEVVTGIADQQNIEIISGLEKDEEIVTGSFKILRELDHGDRVEAKKSPDDKEKK